ARPRSASNQPKIARDDAMCDAPIVANPSTAKASRRCQSDDVIAESDATTQPASARHGTITRLAPNRSSSRPSQGADRAATTVSVPNADEAASRDHEKWSETGF